MKREDCLTQMVNTIHKSKYPLYLFGKGTTTNRVISFLEEYGITFRGVLVNQAFFKEGECIQGYPVYVLEEFLLKNQCDILICTGDWEPLDFKGDYASNIHKIFAYDFWGLLAIPGDLNYWDTGFLQKSNSYFVRFRQSLADDKSQRVFDQMYHQRSTLDYAREFDNPQMQYFDPEIIHIKPNEIFVDCGAYHGENLLEFQRLLSKNRSVLRKAYELEADPLNAEIMRAEIATIEQAVICSAGVWEYVGKVSLSSQLGKSSGIHMRGDLEIPVVTIDSIVGDDNVTFIKMDIEGAELSALRGASITIKRCKPRLAISVYHKKDDIITIPQYISSLRDDYTFYLRAYSKTGCETVLYAI